MVSSMSGLNCLKQWIWGSTFIALALVCPSAAAQFQVSPLVIETEAQQGQARGVINVSNFGSESTEVTVYAAPFTYDESGFVELDSDPMDLSPYLVFSPERLVLEPGQQRRIRLSARLLPSLPDGEYRAVIFIRGDTPTATTTTADGVQVNIVPRIGVLFFVRKGETITSPDLVTAQADGETPGIQLQLANEGTASGRLVVRWSLSQDGTILRSGETEPQIVVADGQRLVTVTYDEPLPGGTYDLTGEIVGGTVPVPFALPVVLP